MCAMRRNSHYNEQSFSGCENMTKGTQLTLDIKISPVIRGDGNNYPMTEDILDFNGHPLSEKKHCVRCKEWKEFDEFNNNGSKKDGKQDECRACRHTMWHAYPLKGQARYAVKQAVKHGNLPKPSELKCKYCSIKAKEYHHPSYDSGNWLDVIPVCFSCHRKIDAKNRDYSKHQKQMQLMI